MDKDIDIKKRVSLFYGMVITAFLLVIIRLWQLQIVKGSEYLLRSKKNKTRVQKILAPRGLVFDCKGRPLIKNNPSFDILLIPQYLKDPKNTTIILANHLLNDTTPLKFDLKKLMSTNYYLPLKIKENISRNELGLISQDKIFLPGIILDVNPKRVYPQGSTASHLLGYVGEITQKELQTLKGRCKNFSFGDLLGKDGVEFALDDDLRGIDGYLELEVDASGRRIRSLNKKEPIPGKRVYLTIDLYLQKLAEECLGNHRGAVVTVDPRNGKVLAMVSHPCFDPNLFSCGMSKKDWEKLIKNPHHPLINRAIQSQIPPGSIYKVIPAIAGLEEGVIDTSTTFYCPGYFKIGNRVFRCWKKGGHGRVNLKQALIFSCDVFFYRLGLILGVEKMFKYARLFGLGEKTGIKLPGEKKGLIPSYNWKKNNCGSDWTSGEIASLAIGQGYNLVTPLQIAMLYAAIANGGILFRPQYIYCINSCDHKECYQKFIPQIIRTIPIKKETLSLISDSLLGVINTPEGTGWYVRNPKISIAGKTGTAQVVEKGKELKRGLSDHAWFVAFVPKESPEIVIVAFLEHGGHGGVAAARVVKNFLNAWEKIKNN